MGKLQNIRKRIAAKLKLLDLEVSLALTSPDKDESIGLRIKGVQHPIYLRKKTSDVPAFVQVFLERQYFVNYGFDPKVIVDCGANIGLASIYYKNKFPKAKIISIEPEASNFALLKKNTEAYDNIHLHQCGIWHSDTQLEIANPDEAEHWAFMTIESGADKGNTIPALSIDSLLKLHNLETIDILKIDIEGSERELFEKNFEQWLPRVKILVIELHDRMRSGCAHSVFKAVVNRDFVFSSRYENLTFDFRKD